MYEVFDHPCVKGGGDVSSIECGVADLRDYAETLERDRVDEFHVEAMHPSGAQCL